MALCQKCGAEMEEDAKFCPACGNPTDQQTQEVTEKPVEVKTNEADDVSDNKLMAILAYISILVLIPLFAAKNSDFARFHTNQGLVLAIAEIILALVAGPLAALTATISPWVATFVTVFISVANIAFMVFTVLGIINAAKGEKKKLPLIGSFKILK